MLKISQGITQDIHGGKNKKKKKKNYIYIYFFNLILFLNFK